MGNNGTRCYIWTPGDFGCSLFFLGQENRHSADYRTDKRSEEDYHQYHLGTLESADARHKFDIASTHLYDKSTDKYTIEEKQLSREELIAFYKDLIASYPIVSIEDPLHEDDFEGFARLTEELGIQIVGDDLFTTNPKRLKKGIDMKAANSLLWKVNQIGTLSEALDAASIAFKHGFSVVVSERSGETEDSIIADLVVGLNAGQIKTGAPVRSERTSKYNRLLQIEEELGAVGKYAGRNFRQPF